MIKEDHKPPLMLLQKSLEIISDYASLFSLQKVIQNISMNTESESGPDQGLDRIRVWTGSGSGPDQSLDRIRVWTGSGSGPDQDRIRVWTGSESGPDQGLPLKEVVSTFGHRQTLFIPALGTM